MTGKSIARTAGAAIGGCAIYHGLLQGLTLRVIGGRIANAITEVCEMVVTGSFDNVGLIATAVQQRVFLLRAILVGAKDAAG